MRYYWYTYAILIVHFLFEISLAGLLQKGLLWIWQGRQPLPASCRCLGRFRSWKRCWRMSRRPWWMCASRCSRPYKWIEAIPYSTFLFLVSFPLGEPKGWSWSSGAAARASCNWGKKKHITNITRNHCIITFLTLGWCFTGNKLGWKRVICLTNVLLLWTFKVWRHYGMVQSLALQVMNSVLVSSHVFVPASNGLSSNCSFK